MAPTARSPLIAYAADSAGQFYGNGGANYHYYGNDGDEYDDEYDADGNGEVDHSSTLPRATPDQSQYILSLKERPPRDSVFALLFAAATIAFCIAAVVAVRSAKHEEGEELRHTVYAALRNSFGVLMGVSAASVLASIVWIMCMSAFVKPIVWGSIIAIPVLCLGLFTLILTDALLGKAHDPIYLNPQYNWMIVLAVAFLIASVGSGTFLYRERHNIDRAVNIIHLACQILWETPSIFTLSLAILFIYTVYSFLWAFAFSHLFLTQNPNSDGVTKSTATTIGFFVLMHFWTSAILSSVEKMAIAATVGQWYFGRSVDETYDEDLVAKSLEVAVGPGFGSVCFAGLVCGTVEAVQFGVRRIRRVECFCLRFCHHLVVEKPHQNIRGNALQTFAMKTLDSALTFLSNVTSQITSYTLIYCGLTGASLCVGAVKCSRLFRRNLVLGMATAGITRAILYFGATAAAGGVGAGAFFYAARGDGSPYAWVVGGVGAVVPFYVVRFMSQIIQNTIDATFVCYMLDVDANANNCQEAHDIFENEMGL
ncbi:hypothetical protein HDU83_005285 [Entophlyctis luteolus]|nr:hypothetical protein HDU83_005285 [Entophlyctis luteolus]